MASIKSINFIYHSLFTGNLITHAFFKDLGNAFYELHTAFVYTVNFIGLDYFTHEDMILSFTMLPFLLPNVNFIHFILILDWRLGVLSSYLEISLLLLVWIMSLNCNILLIFLLFLFSDECCLVFTLFF